MEECKPLGLGSHATIEQHVHVSGGHRLGDGDGDDRDGEGGADFSGDEGGGTGVPGDAVGVGVGELERVRVGTTVGDGVGVVAFNLGYLPGRSSDKAIMTRRESTVAACTAALRVLRPGGVLTVVGYTGHEGGWEEVEAVMELASSLDPKQFTATTHRMINRDNCPQLIAVHKKVLVAAAAAGGGGVTRDPARVST